MMSNFKTMLPSFADELVKLAATVDEKVQGHFQSPDWQKFEKNLGNPTFRAAVLAAPEADKKLKKYVRAMGGYKEGELVGKVQSRTSDEVYDIRRLPSGRLACGCRDWQYKHSTRTTDCDHIKHLKAKRKWR